MCKACDTPRPVILTDDTGRKSRFIVQRDGAVKIGRKFVSDPVVAQLVRDRHAMNLRGEP